MQVDDVCEIFPWTSSFPTTTHQSEISSEISQKGPRKDLTNIINLHRFISFHFIITRQTNLGK